MTSCALTRIDENEYYILYKRALAKNDCAPKYAIYRTQEYGGDLFKDFYYLEEARKIFKQVTKEAIQCAKELV
jgi:hypothetical protein